MSFSGGAGRVILRSAGTVQGGDGAQNDRFTPAPQG